MERLPSRSIYSGGQQQVAIMLRNPVSNQSRRGWCARTWGRYCMPVVLLLAPLHGQASPPSASPVSAAASADASALPDRWLLAMQPAASDTPPASASTPPEWGSTRSHAIPAFEIIGFDSLLNLFDRHHFGCCDFNSNLSSIRRNLHSRWVIDSDSFTVNQLGHPYQGSMYHGFARASGLSYWEGLGYAFAGSALWEIAGEATLPSRNDQISTGIGGSFLGEALFRMANLWLEEEHGPPLLREIFAAVISPPVGFNRLAFGDRFRGLFPSHNPRYYTRLQIGLASATQNEPGTSQGVKRQEAIVDYTLEYGLPGQPGYTYRRPFDYFSFQASASSAVGFDTVLTHGMLLGTDYRLGKNYEG